MLHRLTALVLALIVASPACWCGWTHASVTAHVKSCCAAKAKSAHGAPAKEKDCPCMATLKAREVVQAKVKVPAPNLVDLHVPALTKVESNPPKIIATFADDVPPINGPPREARPLYQLECALLI